MRTSIAKRRQLRAANLKRVLRCIAGREEIPSQRSRETAADIIAAAALGREFVDVVNLPNRGQIANLPQGTVVETLGVINSLGFTPLVAGPLPNGLLELVMPHALNQKMIVEAALAGDWDKAMTALANDPVCGHLSWKQIEKMGLALLRANRRYLPQFFKPKKRR
jgi:alpha-galactosidase